MISRRFAEVFSEVSEVGAQRQTKWSLLGNTKEELKGRKAKLPNRRRFTLFSQHSRIAETEKPRKGSGAIAAPSHSATSKSRRPRVTANLLEEQIGSLDGRENSSRISERPKQRPQGLGQRPGQRNRVGRASPHWTSTCNAAGTPLVTPAMVKVALGAGPPAKTTRSPR